MKKNSLWLALPAALMSLVYAQVLAAGALHFTCAGFLHPGDPSAFA